MTETEAAEGIYTDLLPVLAQGHYNTEACYVKVIEISFLQQLTLGNNIW